MNASAAAGGDETLQSVLQEWANARKRTVVSVVTAGRYDLSERTVMAVWAKMTGRYESVDLVIHSYGGDPNAAYQIVEILRRHIDKGLTAVVPFRAASAATLMCLGCDEIILDELARLGPLDMQVYEDRKGGGYRYSSALNPQIALRQLNEFALSSLRTAKNIFVKDGVLDEEAYQIATGLVIGLFAPLYSQVSPERLAEYSRALDVSRGYARALLSRTSKLSPNEQQKLTEKLVAGYPSHTYYIDYREAKEIKLPVQLVPENLRALAVRLMAQLHSVDHSVYVAHPAPAKVPATLPTAARRKVPRRSPRPVTPVTAEQANQVHNGKRR